MLVRLDIVCNNGIEAQVAVQRDDNTKAKVDEREPVRRRHKQRNGSDRQRTLKVPMVARLCRVLAHTACCQPEHFLRMKELVAVIDLLFRTGLTASDKCSNEQLDVLLKQLPAALLALLDAPINVEGSSGDMLPVAILDSLPSPNLLAERNAKTRGRLVALQRLLESLDESQVSTAPSTLNNPK